MFLLVERGREAATRFGVGADNGLGDGVGSVGREAEATEGRERRRVDAEARRAGDRVGDAVGGVERGAAGVAAIGLGLPRADHAEQGDDPLRAFGTVVEFGDGEVAAGGRGAAEGEFLVLDGVAAGDAEQHGLADIPVDARFTAGHVDIAGAGGGTEVTGRPGLGFLAHAVERKHRTVVGTFKRQTREGSASGVDAVLVIDRGHPGGDVGDAVEGENKGGQLKVGVLMVGKRRRWMGVKTRRRAETQIDIQPLKSCLSYDFSIQIDC